ncbi:hypothetical protein GCM10009654_52520 [Streptomyces hebeiensis]|uniref:Uncharacterized protein n=1 Tax=Streptomyces hebeiensis TaxID=229486 RepID=A0ABP4FRA2_9ACTN
MTHTVYTATVIGEGPANGRSVRVVLGTLKTISPKLALRWLRGQAHRIADRLDPAPGTPWAVGSIVRRVPAGLPDAPDELRRWCDDVDAQRAAWQQLMHGMPVTVNVADHTGRYSLTVWPVKTPSPSRPASPPEFPPRSSAAESQEDPAQAELARCSLPAAWADAPHPHD